MLPRHHVEVVAGPDSQTLVPIEELRVEAGLESDDTSQDTALQAASRAVAAELRGPAALGFAPWRQTYRERLPGRGGDILMLSRWPVESVTSVTFGISSPEAVDAATYELLGGDDPAGPREIYRADGWRVSPTRSGAITSTGGERADYTATYVAGWLLPEQATAWVTATTYAVGAWVEAGDLFARATTAGTSGGSEPTWPTTAGETAVDGTVTWTVYPARELPEDLAALCRIRAARRFNGELESPIGIKDESDEGGRITYRDPGDVAAWSPQEQAILASYR